MVQGKSNGAYFGGQKLATEEREKSGMGKLSSMQGLYAAMYRSAMNFAHECFGNSETGGIPWIWKFNSAWETDKKGRVIQSHQ